MMNDSSMCCLAPAYRNGSLAAEFAAYLAERLIWSDEDFGGGYAWDAEIPPRDQWDAEIEALNAHLATQV